MSDQHPQGLPSLVDQDGSQLRLFGSGDMEGAIFADDEKRGVFTGERLFKSDPDRYKMICSLLAEGLSLRQIAMLCKVSQHTVMAVRDREPALIAAEKQLLGKKMRGAVRLMVDKVIEQLVGGTLEVGSVRDLQSLLVGAGILTDKSELLLGGVTARVEHKDAHKVGDLEDLWEALPADVVDVETVEPDATGLRGDMLPAKGDQGAAAVPAGEELEVRPDTTSTDKLSHGSEA